MLKQISISTWRSLAITWTIIITILFFIPGSAFPKENWLSQIHFDKIVHFGFFALLIFLWRFFFSLQISYKDALLIFIALLYAVAVEIIQEKWVTNRAFDVYDIVADIIGAMAGLLVWWALYKKDKPL